MDKSSKLIIYGKSNESEKEIRCEILDNPNIGLGTSVGAVSKANEDCLGVSILEKQMVFAIADGHWGYEASELAIKKTIELLNPTIRPPKENEARSRLFALNEQINRELFEMGMTNPGAFTSETTLIVCYVKETETGKTLYWSSFGDSFLYLLQNGELRQLNSLNPCWLGLLSKLSENAKTGEIIPNPISSKSRYVGVADGLETGIEQLKSNDYIFLCTDGLIGSDTKADETTLNLIKTTLLGNSSLNAKTHAMIESAIARGETDNVSCIIMPI